MALLVFALSAAPAFAEGPNAILKPTGYAANAIARGDDTSNLVVNLPFTMNWNGTSYSQIYINMNGNCTFGQTYTGYNPSTTLAGTNRNILAPFFADVDTRNTATGQVTYSSTTAGSIPQVDGRNAFFVNWINVASYNNQASPLNSFQLVIVDRSDTGAGNFDFMFNYDKVTWDLATASSGAKARAGWGRTSTSFELPGSGVATSATSTLLDSSSSATSLIQNSRNSDQLGRYVWQVRNGAAPNMPPVISVVDRQLEGNAADGYTGYAGTGDATATDPDGSIASLTHNRPAFLPLGTTTVTWTAVDNLGMTTTATQSIVVRDTTAPTNPGLSSPSHTTSVWSENSTVTIDWAGATDICSGVDGFSYQWFSGAAGTPDTTPDPSTATTVTTTTTTTVDTQGFATSTWPSGWTRSNTTYVTLTSNSGHNHGTYAVEITPSSTTARTFYRDYNLSSFTSASLSFWNQVSALNGTSDYARVEYSTNSGTTWTRLYNQSGASSAIAWQGRSYSLPVGGTVRVRFSASLNTAGEYAGFDDIEVLGFVTTSQPVRRTHSKLDDGTWYFGLRTGDAADNWSSPVSFGPVLIDTVAPVTTDNAPSGWRNSPVTVTLSASDAGTVVSTQYRRGAGAWSAYTAPIVISTEGTTTLQYYSTDAAGHVESTKNAVVRIDTVAPSTPANLSASAESTSSVSLVWQPSTDSLSGFAFYEILRDGVVIDTSNEPSCDDIDLEAGTEYSYAVRAVDNAGNRSATCPAVEIEIPFSDLYLTLDTASVTFPSSDPGVQQTKSPAVTATVGGVGEVPYELQCSAEDFLHEETSTTVLPVGALSFTTSGEITHPSRPFSTAQYTVDMNVGTTSTWARNYVFGYSLDIPWDIDPGTYTTEVTYTVVMR